jgi:acetoacetyl-[acyl-carrier protein] synthase
LQKLPVIIAQGGVSPAGRTSGFYGYRRLIFDNLSAMHKQQTIKALANLSDTSKGKSEAELLSETLIRQITPDVFDYSNIYSHKAVTVDANTAINIKQKIDNKNWKITKNSDNSYKISSTKEQNIMLPSSYSLLVHGAGMLPSGFSPELFYPARNHPRNLAMTVYAISDAIASSGFSVDELRTLVSPTQIGVYAGTAMSAMEYSGFGGMLQARLKSKRVTAKQCPLGFAEMPADFINAYVFGSLGKTSCNLGACASLLYNLEHAISDIQTGKVRIAIVGNSEAPIVPEIIEGYAAMKALTTADDLRNLDNLSVADTVNWTKSCRPFANNAGFTIAESAQYFILMDDELALQTGADILASTAGVFINADGYKKSISSPGAGNYITAAKATGLLRAIVGEKSLQNNSFIQMHGTGTPQNRVTESHIFDEIAKAFTINNWQATAVKNYLGHSIGTAAGDQIMATLGIWQDGIIPGITNTKDIADDVSQTRLNFLLEHTSINHKITDSALINAKGFGGNNATAALLSPYFTHDLLANKHGAKAINSWKKKREKIVQNQQRHNENCLNGSFKPIYRFGEQVLDHNDVSLESDKLTINSYNLQESLNIKNPYS